jgi:glucans biosynthesis protein
MHGGAPGSGAPLGNQNAFKHGHYSANAIAWRRAMRVLLKQARELARAANEVHQ